MNKKTYTMSDAGKEFVDDFMRPGMENLDYTGDSRWEQMSDIHKTSLPMPNLFVSLLYRDILLI